jgi:23S rRNA (uridine2552-2'-O)-methyltransferase
MRGARRGGPRLAGTRTASSRRWLERQERDPFVRAARAGGWRSRAAFKLLQLDDRLRLFRPGQRILDLGAAPGGWSQVAARRVGAGGRVVAVDLMAMEPVPGVATLRLDATDPGALVAIRAALGGLADVVLSDMAAPATGDRTTDHLRVMALCEQALEVARALLRQGGTFVAKVLKGGADRDLLAALRRDFAEVRHVKPPASRTESREVYVIARGFRGAPATLASGARCV